MKLSHVFATSFVLLMATLALAEIPKTISYQGYLKNSDGTPIHNTPVNVSFKLYSTSSGLNPLWSGAPQSVTPKNGIYDTTINPVGLPFDRQYWLGVTVGSEELKPLQQLNSVPYAFRAVQTDNAINASNAMNATNAGNADTVDSLHAGNTSGNLAVNNGTLNTNLNADMLDGKHAADFVDRNSDQTISGIKTFGSQVNFASNGLALGANQLVASGGKIGIGTASPVKSLQVAGDFRVQPVGQYVYVASGSNQAGSLTPRCACDIDSATADCPARNYSETDLGRICYDVWDNGYYDIEFGWMSDFRSNIHNRNTAAPLLETGKFGGVGINTATPYYDLDVNGTVRATQFIGSGSISTPGQIVTTAPNGTAPLVVSSTTYVQNLNADMLDGKHASSFVDVVSNQPVAGIKTFNNDVTLSENLNLPATTATTGIIKSGANTLIHTYSSEDPYNDNFFAGVNAGNLTTTTWGNTGIGNYALNSNTTGGGNVATGRFALNKNTTGYNNTATGAQALYQNMTGYRNAAFGFGALQFNTTGYLNTASGNEALYHNTTGYYNTANGHNTLAGNSTGARNTASGAFALQANSSSDNTASGYLALGTNTTGHHNTASGSEVLFGNSSGSFNVAMGFRALETNDTGNYNTALGTDADVTVGTLSNATAIGYNAIVDVSNKVRIGNTAVTVIGGQVAWSNLSDMREKKDIRDVTLGLDFIKALRPVEFRMIDGNDRSDLGFIAQDIEALLGTNYNVLGIGGTGERKLSLRYTDFIAPMVKAMQEQQATIEQLKAELAELRKLLGK